MRLKDFEAVTLPINFRSVAHIASLLWMFTEDVDVMPTGEDGLYFILGKGSRYAVRPEDLDKEPIVLKRGSPWTPE